MPKQAVEVHGDGWTTPEHHVGNGVYRIDTWRRGIALTLGRRAGKDGPAKVELRFTDSEDTALRWFEAGEVDVVDGLVPLDRVDALRRSRPGAVRSGPAASVFYLAPNLRVPPFDEANLRRAVTRGLDRETLVGVVLGTGQVPAHSIVPGVVSEISGYRPPEECVGRNIDTARAAMAASGHPGGAGLPTVEILYNQSATMTRIMTFVQQDLRDAMGLQTSLRSMEWAAFLDAVRAGEFSIARFGLSGEPDPMDFLGAMTTGAPNNIGGFASPEYDRLVEVARGTSDASRRNALLSQAESILCEAAAVIPVYHSVTVLLARKGVQGYEANHSGLHPLRDVTLETQRP